MLRDFLWLCLDMILLFVVCGAICEFGLWRQRRKEHRILCPECKRKRGFIVSRTTLEESTSTINGREQRDCECAECGAKFVMYRELPRRRVHANGGFFDSDYSSSSGSSGSSDYGGGSFSGGGSGTRF